MYGLKVLLIVQSLSAAQPTNIRVLVLDGNNGTPLRGHIVEIYSNQPAPDPIVRGATDQNGLLTVAAPLPSQIAVHVKGRYLCSGKHHGTFVQALKDIVSTGVADENLCAPKVSRHARPGELILYVRRETISELLDLK